MKFSLILPTYKVEDYIASCLESCCNQTAYPLEEYEIIIVNDESPDNSVEVARQVFKRYPNHNWKIIDRKNGGLSAARNTGLLHASGDYIWFIDSDDFIEAESLYTLSKIVETSDYDIVNFTHKTIFKNDRVEGAGISFEGYDISGVSYLKNTSFLSAWTCIYKKQFLIDNNLKFKEGVIWEDSEFNTRAYMLTSRCHCISNALYNYVRRENSISDIKATVFSTTSRISNAFDLDEYFNSTHCSTYELAVAYSSIASMLIAAIAGLPELSNRDCRYFRKEIFSRKEQYWRILFRCYSLRSKIILFCYWVLPSFSEKLLNRQIQKAIQRTIND